MLNAKLTNANLTDATLSSAYMIGANATGANLTRTAAGYLYATGALFARVRGQATDFIYADLRGADFTSASFTRPNPAVPVDGNNGAVSFHGANLERAKFANASMSWAMLSAPRASNATFPPGVNLSSSNPCGAEFMSAAFTNAKLSAADVNGADLRDADFSAATLTNANSSGASLLGAKITNQTVLTNAYFSNATWTDGKKCKPGSRGICNP